MNNKKLREWANNIELKPRIRNPGSKHQKKINEIQDLVLKARENPSIEVYNQLRQIQFIACSGETEYVSHCRYLQYWVNKLDDVVHKNEGSTE